MATGYHSVHPLKEVHYAEAGSAKAAGQGPGGEEDQVIGCVHTICRLKVRSQVSLFKN